MIKRRSHLQHLTLRSPQENLEAISLLDFQEEPWKPRSNQSKLIVDLENTIAAWNEEDRTKLSREPSQIFNSLKIKEEEPISCYPSSIDKKKSNFTSLSSRKHLRHEEIAPLGRSYRRRRRSSAGHDSIEISYSSIKYKEEIAIKPIHRDYLRKKSGQKLKSRKDLQKERRAQSI